MALYMTTSCGYDERMSTNENTAAPLTERELVAFPVIDLAKLSTYGDPLTRELVERFPDQDMLEFLSCNQYNPVPDEVRIDGSSLVKFAMVLQGANEDANWIWDLELVVDREVVGWRVVAGCDYTGWDCQSFSEWERKA